MQDMQGNGVFAISSVCHRRRRIAGSRRTLRVTCELIGLPIFSEVNEVLRKEITTMFIYESNEKNILNRSEAYYEDVASQEEVYLEEVEEELRLILTSDDLPPPRSESPNAQREHAAEELIVGDSDDPPLSEEAVKEMLRNDLNIQKSSRSEARIGAWLSSMVDTSFPCP